MTYTLEQIKQKIKCALDQLWQSDKHLLKNNVNERSITHKLAIYIESEFEGYRVDCEYNRNGPNIKIYREIVEQINRSGIKANDTKAKTAFPDIIVHKRGNNNDNLLVIEVKKLRGDATQTNSVDEVDKKKLKAFTHENQLKYKYGLALQIPVDGGNTANLFWFEKGAEKPPQEEYSMQCAV